jgi:hypothetical protein
MFLPLAHPEVFDAAVKACLAPDRERLRVLLLELNRLLALPEAETGTRSVGRDPSHRLSPESPEA